MISPSGGESEGEGDQEIMESGNLLPRQVHIRQISQKEEAVVALVVVSQLPSHQEGTNIDMRSRVSNQSYNIHKSLSKTFTAAVNKTTRFGMELFSRIGSLL